MKKKSPKEILFGYQKNINISISEDQCFSPLWHFHPEYEFVYIIESNGKRFIGDHVGNFKSGDLYFIGKRLPHMWMNDPAYFNEKSTQRACSMVVHFNLGFLNDAFIQSEICDGLNQLLKKSERGIQIKGTTKAMVLKLMEEMEGKSGLDRYAILLQIMQTLIESNTTTPLSSAGYTNNFVHDNSERINKINEYIVQNFRNKITLPEVAALAHMNVTSFCRYFKMKTQQSFNQYLTEFRIGHAKKLLLHTDLSVTQVCFEIGFNNLANFNRHFKKSTNLTPKNYRKLGN